MSLKIKMAKPKSVDLVAWKNGRKLAFEIETGKNSLDQIVQNLSKCVSGGCQRVYLVPTNPKAYRRIYWLLGYEFSHEPTKMKPLFCKRAKSPNNLD